MTEQQNTYIGKSVSTTTFQLQVTGMINHIPETVTENESAITLWYMPVNTDNANRPDIIVRDKKANNCLMIDMTIP